MANYYKYFGRFIEAFKEARAALTAGPAKISISNGNTKMGAVASFSTLPYVTCPACCADTCGKDCYAAKIAGLRPSVLKAYARNTAAVIGRPDETWAEIDKAVKGVRFFRFHVSGDIIDSAYFGHMVEIARNNPHTEILAFTKRFGVVNDWIAENGELPENLHILFSGWENLKPENPHDLPETNVVMPNMEPPEDWKICGGNCFECACRGVGCWQAKKGDVIAFELH